MPHETVSRLPQVTAAIQGQDIAGRRYSGLQPQYFPRLHYVARILNADIYMIRDDAQYVRKHKYPDGKTGKSFQAHSPIKQSFGVNFLTLPIKDDFLPLAETRISYDTNWIQEHLLTLRVAYGRALNFSRLFPEIEALLTKRYESLAELNTATFFWGVLHLLGEDHIASQQLSWEYIITKLKEPHAFRLKEIRKASESIALKATEKPLNANEKILALCQEAGANEDYCGGTSVAAYVDLSLFEQHGLKITVQDWFCQEYPQLFTKQQGFITNLSIIDLLMNVSTQDAVKIIQG